MTYDEICICLKKAGIENYSTEARILIEEFCPPFSFDKSYDSEKLNSAIRRRCERYPLQYIIGKWWFARCEFEVSEDCLVPRPDTELIVELACKLLPENAAFADLCTGSGCIAVSVLDMRKDTLADAYELYPKTLAIAERNAEKNGVMARFTPVLADVLDEDALGNVKYSAIISNPPYIRSKVIDTLEPEVKKEPRAALDGGCDGLVFYRSIVKNFSKNLEEDGFFLFEIGYDQGADIKKIADDFGFACEVKKDLGGCDRAAILRR